MFLSHFPVLPCQAAVNLFFSENKLHEKERLGERRKEGNQEC